MADVERRPDINLEVADKLSEMAEILELQDESGFRIAAYRRAAETVRTLDEPLDRFVRENGLPGLVELPGIGKGIGSAIVEIVTTGAWPALDRLTGQMTPEKLFQTVPGIGPGLAHDIHEQLHIETLEDLELAAHDGRLDSVPKIGFRRLGAIRSYLKERLRRKMPRASSRPEAPGVAMLLDVDREYRQKARHGELRRIRPKRFNPEGKAWLPVLHTGRGDWHFTALFSNTHRAHQLKKTGDWVVLFYYKGNEAERQCTVVSEHVGPLKGSRVVRGRERECLDHYKKNRPTGSGKTSGTAKARSRRPGSSSR